MRKSSSANSFHQHNQMLQLRRQENNGSVAKTSSGNGNAARDTSDLHQHREKNSSSEHHHLLLLHGVLRIHLGARGGSGSGKKEFWDEEISFGRSHTGHIGTDDTRVGGTSKSSGGIKKCHVDNSRSFIRDF